MIKFFIFYFRNFIVADRFFTGGGLLLFALFLTHPSHLLPTYHINVLSFYVFSLTLFLQAPARAKYKRKGTYIMRNELSIKHAATSALNNLRRVSFSGDGFTKEQTDAIAEAIVNAIVEYDKQLHSEKL